MSKETAKVKYKRDFYKIEKESKNCWRYEELPDKSGKILIGGLYVKKDAVKDVHKKLRVTVEVLE